ncbi:hypothetical protein AWB71_03745 [Caballeronia peredens]|nr:hypothetical protein AWB71_03745 [Caballeronia peredens]
MKSISHPYYIASLLATVSLVAAMPAHAQLGAARDADSAAGDVIHRAQSGLVEYHETTDPSGIVVREYVDSSGKVYAVSWRGPAMPNVQSLLGAYFDTFKEGANATIGAAGLHTARVAQGDLVVENRMRLREFSGRAWLASALPPGVSATDIE